MPFSPTMKIHFQQTNWSLCAVVLHRKGSKWKSFGGIGVKREKKRTLKHIPFKRLVDQTHNLYDGAK